MTPPFLRMLPASLSFSSVKPEQQPLDGDEAVAGLLGGLFRGVERARQFRRQIDLPGAAARNLRQLVERVLGRFQDRARIAAGAVDQTAGQAFAVVQQHFQQMQRRKLLVAVAHRQRLRRLDKAARTLGVFFNIHRYFPQPAAPPRRHGCSIFIGFPRAALTFLNRQAVVADARAGLRQMWEGGSGNGRGELHKFVCGGARPRESLKKPDDSIPSAQIAGLYRYPVKGLSPEPLPQVALGAARRFPADRRYAIENGPSGFDPAAPAWLPKSVFLMLMRNERLAALRTHFDDASHVLTIRKDGSDRGAQGDLETAEGRAAIEAFFATNFASELKGPPKLLSGGGHSFSDVARKVVSIINLASVAAIENIVGRRLIRCDSAPTSMSAAGRPGTSSICSTKPLRSARRG